MNDDIQLKFKDQSRAFAIFAYMITIGVLENNNTTFLSITNWLL